MRRAAVMRRAAMSHGYAASTKADASNGASVSALAAVVGAGAEVTAGEAPRVRSDLAPRPLRDLSPPRGAATTTTRSCPSAALAPGPVRRAFAASNLAALAARTSEKWNCGAEHAAPSLASAAEGDSSRPAYAMRPPAAVARITARKDQNHATSRLCLGPKL